LILVCVALIQRVAILCGEINIVTPVVTRTVRIFAIIVMDGLNDLKHDDVCVLD
jgi:hypothetical protein